VIPLKDENPTSRPAIVTVALIVACVAVYLLVQSGQDAEDQARFTYEHAAIPCEIVTGQPLEIAELSQPGRCERADLGTPELFPGKSVWMSVLVSMFLHGSLLHIGGNMLYLWIFGNNVEDRLGHVAYLAFYLVGGIVATGAFVLVNRDSTVPLVGASGAIAAVMGAYLVWFPNARIRTLLIAFFIFFTDVRAKWLLAFWFVLQFFTGENSGVAWMAHVGGFVFGAAAGLFLGPGGRAVSRR
jgi:membrane associated rhomboid family serine protease